MLPQPPMARIPYPPTDPENSAALLAKLPPLHVFQMLAWSPPALQGFVRMGTELLYNGCLNPILRELVIVRVGHLCGSEYEVRQHEHSLRALGVPTEIIAAIPAGPAAVRSAGPDLPDATGRALMLADCMVTGDDSGPAVDAVRELLDERATVELTVTIGYYMMVSRVLTTLDIDIEDDDAFLKI
jgi:4-carboxymuconolactone decarboxylase